MDDVRLFFTLIESEVMNQDIVALAKKLIPIKSIHGNDAALSEVLDIALSGLTTGTIEHFEHNGIKSALIYNTPTRPKKFKVLLNGHLDVIPGKDEEYAPRIRGNRLYGVGSMDMKANAACLIAAFNDVAEKISYPLALQLVTDEEVGGFDGTKYHIEQGVRAECVIAGEPMNLDIVHKAKGVLWLDVFFRGVSAHGAYPWRGQNAILAAQTFIISLMKTYPTPKADAWKTTVNIARIETTNTAFNKIPDQCKVSLDIRFTDKESRDVLRRIKKLLPRGASLSVVANEPALITDANNPYVQALRKTAERNLRRKVVLRGTQGSSDARHFAKYGTAGMEFGPIGGNIGADNEWVDIKSLGQFHKILTEFLLNLS